MTTTWNCASVKRGVHHVEEDFLAGRLQIPRGSLFRNGGNSDLSLHLSNLDTDFQHGLYRNARNQRVTFNRPHDPLCDVLLPRLPPKVEEPCRSLDGEGAAAITGSSRCEASPAAETARREGTAAATPE